jgi:hypothetical protein
MKTRRPGGVQEDVEKAVGGEGGATLKDMRGRQLLAAGWLTVAVATGQDSRLQPILERLSEEASVFATNAKRVIAEERLLHRGMPAAAFRLKLKVGQKATSQPPYVEREIISEYGFGVLKDKPDSLREFRQPLRVDGAPVKGAERARLTLAKGVSSEDDRERKRMLEEFEKLGMVGAASDFGQMILLFQRPALRQMHFNYKAQGELRGEPVTIVEWYQQEDEKAARVFQGREMVRVRMKGEIWARESDQLPVRITVSIPVQEHDTKVVHEGVIDYYRSRHGVLLPSVVKYKKWVDSRLAVENYSIYSKYRMFRAEAEIKFTTEEGKPE